MLAVSGIRVLEKKMGLKWWKGRAVFFAVYNRIYMPFFEFDFRILMAIFFECEVVGFLELMKKKFFLCDFFLCDFKK